MAREDLSFGGIVYRRSGGQIEILMIQDRYGRWTFPKGHPEPGETPEQTALREILEESGVRAELEERLPDTTYEFLSKGTLVRKTVVFYLARAAGGTPQPLADETLDAVFVPLSEVEERLDYANLINVFQTARDVLIGRWQN